MPIVFVFPSHAYGPGGGDDDDVVAICYETTPLVDCQTTKCLVILVGGYKDNVMTIVLRNIVKMISYYEA